MKGYIIPNVILPPLCSSYIKSGPPGETAQVATQFIAELVQNNIIMDLEKLCINNSKWAWVLHCDFLCINLDGSLLDACVMALVSALKNCIYILKFFFLHQNINFLFSISDITCCDL